MALKYFDAFTGIGGFTKAIQNILPDAQCVGYSEILSSAIAIYRYHYPQHQNFGDITKIKPEELPDFDLLTGGFPCQAFSVAGQRKGFNDTRGTLFFDVAKIIKIKTPRIVFLENVRGLIYHNKGRTFKTILGVFDELGYDVQWCVLNSKNFGVPQHRSRIYIVGHLRKTPRPEIFSALKFQSTIVQKIEPGICLSTLSASYPKDNVIFSTLTASGAGIWSKCGSNAVKLEEEIKETENGRLNIRSLTPLECERIMGYGDDWTKFGRFGKGDLIWNGEINVNRVGQHAPHMVFAKEAGIYPMVDSSRYFTLGNGVVPNVVEFIIKQIYE